MIRAGDCLPDIPVTLLTPEGPQTVGSARLFSGRAVIAFGLPGAFTPTCSSQQLPRYEELADLFQAHGADAVLCIAVNDPYVMAAWAANQDVRKVRMVADGNGAFTEKLGLLLDKRGVGMGYRSRRYAMIVRDGRLERMFAEPDREGDPFEVSDADTVFRHFVPDAAAPPHLALISKPGCPHCARARQTLRESGLPFTELNLADAQRARVLAAVAGEISAPQIFADGRRIGGGEALQRWLEQRRAQKLETAES